MVAEAMFLTIGLSAYSTTLPGLYMAFPKVLF